LKLNELRRQMQQRCGFRNTCGHWHATTGPQ
jgi:hypothetical protein